jgi:hypothetical protein
MPLFGNKKNSAGGDHAVVAAGDTEVFSMRGREAASSVVRSFLLFEISDMQKLHRFACSYS